MERVNILITGMGSSTAISVLKGLRKQKEIDIKIIGTDINEKTHIAGSSFCDNFYRVPYATNDNYIPRLLEICEKEKIKIIFPIIDIELEVMASAVDIFKNKGIFVWLSDKETINICNNKYNTYKFFIEKGFPTPKTWLPEELGAIEKKLSFPLIVKPIDGVSSRDVIKVESRNDLALAINKIKNPIIQEYIEGKEYTIDVLCDYDSNVLAVVPRERVETKAGISYKGRTAKDEKLIYYGRSISEKLRIKGACNIQCIINNGKPIFLEINPRFSGGLPLTIEAGINSPLLLVKMAIGEDLSKENFEFNDGVYMARYWEEVFYYGN